MKDFKEWVLIKEATSINRKSLNKQPARWNAFKNRVLSGEPFEGNNGDKIVIDKSVLDGVTSANELPDKLTSGGKPINWSSLAKTPEFDGAGGAGKLSSAGDVAEGILAICMYMKFASISMNETEFNKILYKLKENTVTSITKTNGKVDDIINLHINLAPTHFKSLTKPDPHFEDLRRSLVSSSLEYASTKNINTYKKHFESNEKADIIDIRADGLGDQKGTKTDLYVTLSRNVNDKLKTRRLRLDISLKAGSIEQFGQVSGSKYENQQNLWGAFGFSLKNIKVDYEKLIANGQQSAAIKLAYEEAQKQFASAFNKKGVTEIAPIITLLKAIIHHATLGEHIELVQLDKGTFHSYKMNKTDAKIKAIAKEHDFTVVPIKMSEGSNGINLPTLTIKVDGEPFLAIRSKQDKRPVAEEFYARNYIEKKKGFKKVFM